jgi:predicted PurR-regulated permease PerM
VLWVSSEFTGWIICCELNYDSAVTDDLIPRERTSIPAEPPRKERPRYWAQNLIGVGVIFGLCYYGESILAVLLVSVLLAFVLAPVVDFFTYMKLPRSLAAFIALLLLMAAAGSAFYFSYSQAMILLQDLPKYTVQVREEVVRYRKKAETLEVLNPEQKGVMNVRPATDWSDLLKRGFGSLTALMFAASFVPFLAFFMLTWQGHVRSATVSLFSMENRQTAYVTLGLISAMIRSFMVGNLVIGFALGLASTAVFGLLHLPFFYFVGFISGFLSLVPYLGPVLALAPPVFVAIGHNSSSDFVYIFMAVLGLHLIALNVLYPMFLGKRLQLNPLAVTMSLLLWAFLWGAIGLLLAIPITAAMKIIFDHVESLKPYGAWLGE